MCVNWNHFWRCAEAGLRDSQVFAERLRPFVPLKILSLLSGPHIRPFVVVHLVDDGDPVVVNLVIIIRPLDDDDTVIIVCLVVVCLVVVVELVVIATPVKIENPT